MSKPSIFDFYGIEDLLSEEEKIARDTVRRFITSNLLPIIADYFEKGEFPLQIVPQAAELGVFGVHLQGYGCAGMNNIAYGLIMQELERGDSGMRSFASVQGSLVMYAIYTFGTEEQKNRWLPPMARGEALGCFGLTEPDFGSDPGGMLTKAIKDGSNYILNGTKMWITNGSIADVALVWAKTPEGVRGFLVEKETPGLSARDITGKFSLRASFTSELVLENCCIPEDNCLPGVVGLKGPLTCLNQARYGIAWGALGSAMASFECARSYAMERIQFGKPIASFQLVQQKLSWMLTEITKAQLLVLRLGRLKDEQKAHHSQISMAKMNNVQIALECARVARDILGASGICHDYPVARHLCNLESVKTYEGTHDIHQLIIGREITGISAFF